MIVWVQPLSDELIQKEKWKHTCVREQFIRLIPWGFPTEAPAQM